MKIYIKTTKKVFKSKEDNKILYLSTRRYLQLKITAGILVQRPTPLVPPKLGVLTKSPREGGVGLGYPPQR